MYNSIVWNQTVLEQPQRDEYINWYVRDIIVDKRMENLLISQTNNVYLSSYLYLLNIHAKGVCDRRYHKENSFKRELAIKNIPKSNFPNPFEDYWNERRRKKEDLNHEILGRPGTGLWWQETKEIIEREF